jgi:hypothetical protein
VDLGSITLAAFTDELEKIGVSHGLTHVSKGRKGTRSISAARLLEKDRDGSLYKKKLGDSQGNPQDVRGDSVDDPGAAQPPKHKGDVPTKGDDNISVEQKTGSSGYQEIMLPVSSGEDMRAGNARPRQPGEVPSQDSYLGVSASKVPIGGRPITSDISAKKPRPGETPTSDRNMNIVDRGDMRENVTTVTGLGQSSTGIGSFNAPAEHA